jgi:hypothetical protein
MVLGIEQTTLAFMYQCDPIFACVVYAFWHHIILPYAHLHRSWGSSGSIVSHCGLDDRAIGVRSPAGSKDFSSILCVQTGSGAHPASCTMGTGGPFPGGKAQPGRDADHSPPSSAEVMKKLELYFLSPQAPPWRVAGLLYFCLTPICI